jgi:outer membrane protein TolC
MTRTPYVLVLGLLAAAGTAAAQPAPAPQKAADQAVKPADEETAFQREIDSLFVQGGLTSEEAAKRGPGASPTVVKQAQALAAAAAQLESARLLQVPRINGTASYTRLSFIAPVNLGFGGMSFKIPFLQNQYVLQGQVAVPLSDYFLRFPSVIDAAKYNQDSADVNELNSKVGAAQDARLAYYEWVRARLSVVIARRQLAQVQATLQQERALADVQRVSRADLLRIESQAASTQQSLDVLTNVVVLREEQLRLLIGASETEKLEMGEDIRGEVKSPEMAQLDDLQHHAVAQRLDLKSIDYGIRAKEAQADQELANQLPHLSAFANFDYDNPNQRIFPQQANFKFTWLAGLQLTWVLNDYLQSKTSVDRINAEANELRADRENLVRATRIEVLSAQQAVQVALLALQTSKTALDSAEEGYRVRRELLNAERATAVELVDAQTTLTQARVASLNARIDLRVAISQLAHALGDDIKSTK